MRRLIEQLGDDPEEIVMFQVTESAVFTTFKDFRDAFKRNRHAEWARLQLQLHQTLVDKAWEEWDLGSSIEDFPPGYMEECRERLLFLEARLTSIFTDLRELARTELRDKEYYCDLPESLCGYRESERVYKAIDTFVYPLQ